VIELEGIKIGAVTLRGGMPLYLRPLTVDWRAEAIYPDTPFEWLGKTYQAVEIERAPHKDKNWQTVFYEIQLVKKENTQLEDKPVSAKWYSELSEREQKEINLADFYSENLAHGTTGHNQLMLIAKLGKKLNEYEDRLNKGVNFNSIGYTPE
jgi:hypothetical protein